jgi:rubrerythrin
MRVDGMRVTRASFLALVAAGLAAPRAFGDIRDDIQVLQFALTLEYIESSLYRDALKDVAGLGEETRRLVTELRDNEVEHVDALRATIAEAGGRPTDRPSVDFGEGLRNETAFLKLANTLEDTGVSAYNGAAPRFENSDFVAAFASIAQVEARHAALVRLARERPPAPLPLDKASNEDAVRQTLSGYRAR